MKISFRKSSKNCDIINIMKELVESEISEPVREDNFYCRMIYQICREEGIKLDLLCYNFVKRLEKDGKVRFVMGYKFDLNPHGEGMVLDDKYATYSALKCVGVPAVEHLIVYPSTNQNHYARGRNTVEYVVNYFHQNHNHIVLKPNCGAVGRGVTQITDERQIVPTLVDLFSGNETVSMSPFYEILHEYRVVLLDGEVQLDYMKVLTDKSTWKFNLKQGSTVAEIPEDKREEVITLAKEAAVKIGLRFGSVDVVEISDGELMVLEINSGVMIRQFTKLHPEREQEVYEIYRRAIRKMFE